MGLWNSTSRQAIADVTDTPGQQIQKSLCILCGNSSEDYDYQDPVQVTITGATGQIGSILCFMIAQGQMFGPNQKVSLRLQSQTENLLKGLQHELEDGAFSLLTSVSWTTDIEQAFQNSDVALLSSSVPRGSCQVRSQLLMKNAEIFKQQGEALNKYAKKSIKILVISNPCNTNALICSKYAPTIPKENFTALTRLDHNRAKSFLSKKIGCSTQNVKNLIVWGNHSEKIYPDISNTSIISQNTNNEQPISKILNLDQEFQDLFFDYVQQRGVNFIKITNKTQVGSVAVSICDHMRDWWQGTKEGEYTSMAVISDDNGYGISDGIIYSFPCEVKNRKITIIKGLNINQSQLERLKAGEQELLDERKLVLDY